MIRYPHRYHASVTPGAAQIEPHYQAEETQERASGHRRWADGGKGPRDPERHYSTKPLDGALAVIARRDHKG